MAEWLKTWTLDSEVMSLSPAIASTTGYFSFLSLESTQLYPNKYFASKVIVICYSSQGPGSSWPLAISQALGGKHKGATRKRAIL